MLERLSGSIVCKYYNVHMHQALKFDLPYSHVSICLTSMRLTFIMS